MKIINLVEDSNGNNNCKSEHGLSFYIETSKYKILFDTGASNTFIYNARDLGIDLKEVDIVILSHGHYDHCGGVLDFIRVNSKATIYIQECARFDFYNLKNNQEKYIGIDKTILELPQVKIIDGDFEIYEELYLFKNNSYDVKMFNSNNFLKQKVNNKYIQDKFTHEQNLVITENDKSVLFLGCAHNGILNIISTYRKHFYRDPSIVIGGFHFIKDNEYDEDEVRIIQETANKLKDMDTVFYTGHCTGNQAFDIMKKIMKNKLILMHSGFSIL